MPIKFYEKEYAKMQAYYNRIYRLHRTPDLKSQCKVIFAIISLGMFCVKISQAPTGTISSKDKARFIQTRNWLYNEFEQIENIVRRHHLVPPYHSPTIAESLR